MKKFAVILVIFQIYCLKAALACNGYNVSISDITKCEGSAQLVRFADDFAIKLTKECYFITTGCMYYKAYKTAQLEFSMAKDGIPLITQQRDLCVNSFNGAVCPAKADKTCFRSDSRKSLKPFRRLLATVEGQYDIDYTISHDGETSCGSMKVVLAKY